MLEGLGVAGDREPGVALVETVDDLVGEIATASNEQTEGISQVSTAVAQMDKVTQTTAANAEESASAAEQLQAEKEALIEDRNVVVDALAEATNQLWQTKLDTPIAPKKLKNGIGASYMILGGSKPIYQLTYEKPLTKNISVEVGGLWNGKPGVSGGVKVRF